jgi:hypothetical protein
LFLGSLPQNLIIIFFSDQKSSYKNRLISQLIAF